MVRLPVQRSVETGLAVEFKARFTRQPSRDPDAEDPKPGAYAEFPFSKDLFYICLMKVVLFLQFNISWSKAGVRQTVHGLPGGIRPRPVGRAPNTSHAPYG